MPVKITGSEELRGLRTGAKAIIYQVTTPPAALAASQTANLIQVGFVDVQSPNHLDTVISQLTHQRLRHPAHPTHFLCNRTVQTFLQHSLWQATFCCSALATWNSLSRTVTDIDTLRTFKSNLKIFLFCQALN